MAIYRIKITMADGKQKFMTGLFLDGFEASMQALADFPSATKVKASWIGGAA